MRKTIAVVCLSLFLFATLWWWNSTSSLSNAPTVVPTDAPAAIDPANTAAHSTALALAKKHEADRENQRDKASASTDQAELWQRSDQAQQELQGRGILPVDLAGEVYVQLNTAYLQRLRVGDTMKIYIPQLGKDMAATVDHVSDHDNGDRTVEANFPGMAKFFSAVITSGKDATYGEISTPSGVYLLEAAGDYGWIAARGDLVKNHWSGHNDGVYPPKHTATN